LHAIFYTISYTVFGVPRRNRIGTEFFKIVYENLKTDPVSISVRKLSYPFKLLVTMLSYQIMYLITTGRQYAGKRGHFELVWLISTPNENKKVNLRELWEAVEQIEAFFLYDTFSGLAIGWLRLNDNTRPFGDLHCFESWSLCKHKPKLYVIKMRYMLGCKKNNMPFIMKWCILPH
jgi:hypothetical protein